MDHTTVLPGADRGAASLDDDREFRADELRVGGSRLGFRLLMLLAAIGQKLGSARSIAANDCCRAMAGDFGSRNRWLATR